MAGENKDPVMLRVSLSGLAPTDGNLLAIHEGKDMKEDGYVYENFELKKKGGD